MNWTLLRPFAPYLAGLLSLIAAYACGDHNGYQRGVKAEKAAEQVRLETARKKVVKREAKAEAITTDVARDLSKERVRIITRTQTLTREVVRYVPQAADDRCIVPHGFRLLHDAAASGSEAEVPSAPGGSEQPSGIALSVASGTIIGNYGQALAWRAEAQAWREWWKAQDAAWGKP